MKLSRFLFALVALTVSTVALHSETAEASYRTSKRFGIHAGLLGDPFPTLLGYNVNFNAASFLRLTAGYGSISGTSSDGTTIKLSTMGGGARLFVPGWNFSPVVGASWAKVTLSGISSSAISGFSADGSHIYATAGFDWQAGNGFNFGFGANYSLKSGVDPVPYLNLGWYF